MNTPELNLGELPPAALEDVELGAAATSAPGGASSSNAPPPPTPEEKKRLEALGTAAMLVSLGAMVASKKWPRIVFTDDEKNGLASVSAPVLAKYDLGSAFLDEYKEEAALVMFLLGLARKKSAELTPAPRPGDQARDINPPPGAPPGDQAAPESMSAFEAVQRGIYT